MANQGHAEHTKDAKWSETDDGAPLRPFKIVFLGAGSGFAPRLLNDVLSIRGADRGEIALVDIDAKRLEVSRRLIGRLIESHGRSGWTVRASVDRRKLLKGANYIINCIEVSGLACVDADADIPAAYGVDQCIGDTIGPGGLFKGLRTIPVWLKVLKDAEELCPDALVLNYTNPMNMMCLAAGRTSAMQVVGLCHSVQGTSELLARRAGVRYEDMEWDCAGINHLAWFTTLRHNGRDLYPRLKRAAARELADPKPKRAAIDDFIRKDIMLQFGAFVTESSGHLSEYLPYYRKRRDLIRRYCGKRYQGESRFYATNWPAWRKQADRDRANMLRRNAPLSWPRSWEYASWIIEACERNRPFRFHGNVMNNHRGAGPLIGNLPADGCVEVACMAAGGGIEPVAYGRLPPQMAALCASNMRMFDLAATAAMEKSVEAAIHALMLDPLTAAVCSPAEIREMTLKLFKAQKPWLKGYR